MIRRGRRADGGWLNEVLIGVMGTRGDHVRLQLGRGCFRFDRQAGKEASKYIHTKKTRENNHVSSHVHTFWHFFVSNNMNCL